jgi:hypothetical protein
MHQEREPKKYNILVLIATGGDPIAYINTEKTNNPQLYM